MVVEASRAIGKETFFEDILTFSPQVKVKEPILPFVFIIATT